MFSYRHIYHAGNFADVMKHITLTFTLQALHQKDKPIFFLDCHAGIGRYDLHAEQAVQTGEYHQGIEKLWQEQDLPCVLQPYMDAVRSLNTDQALRYYPGSPGLARYLLRPQDRMALVELNKYDFATLKNEFAGDRQVTVHLQDAYQSLKAFLPPRERRGLVLIDPTFELKDEYQRLMEGIVTGWKKWPTGCFAIWYPLMSPTQVNTFHKAMRATEIPDVLCVELAIAPLRDPPRMSGSGMLIINPPWQLDIQLKNILPWLLQRLAIGEPGGTRVEWLSAPK